MWSELKHIEEFNKLEYKSKLITLIEKCINYKFENNCYIHGDLGVWNLLFNKRQIHIIDFGEVRKGNNHFDISAVISSSIDWNKGENELITSLMDFRNGYKSNFGAFKLDCT